MDFNAQDSSFGRSTQPRTIHQQSNTHLRPAAARILRTSTTQPKNYYDDTISYTKDSDAGTSNSETVLRSSINAKYIQAADGDLSNLSAKQLRTYQNRLAQRAYRENKTKKRSGEDDASLKSESASSPEVSRAQSKLPKFERISPVPSEEYALSDSGFHSPFQPLSCKEGLYLGQAPSFASESNSFHQSASQQDPLEQMSLHIESLEASNSQQQHTILEQQRMIQDLRAQVGADNSLFPSLPTSPYGLIPVDANENRAELPQIQLPPLDAYQALPEDFNFDLDEQLNAPHLNQWNSNQEWNQQPTQHHVDQFQQPHEWMNDDMSQMLADSP